ncbi:MAG TPA: hypothetical protein VI895_06335 [Bdellovibrionota bacterium]|nr:hypothetical protein [Bdellovibrionota bacterium]
MRRSFVCLFLGFVFLGCDKPKSLINEFDVDEAPRNTFTKLVTSISGKGFVVSSVDMAGMTLATNWKEIETDNLKKFALLSGDVLHYDKGRVRCSIAVTDRNGNAHIKIDAQVEGLFHGKQAGTSGTGSSGWSAERSTGEFEKSLVKEVSGG